MSTQRIHLRGTVDSRAAAADLLSEAGDAVLIVRGVPRWLLLRCPCGCGETLPINLDRRAGKAWRLYKSRRDGVSLYPSVWRDTGCGSHFIIWRDQISLFDDRYEEDWPIDAADIAILAKAVIPRLTEGRGRSYVDVADELGEIPWDVLRACRKLVRDAIAEEGSRHHRGEFALLPGAGTERP